jgi:CDP-glucose 4,6-dehydratase
MNKRIIITGHKGFIGSWLTCLLKHYDWEIYGIDDHSSYGERLYDVAGFGSLVTKELIADISDDESWYQWAIDCAPTAIVHLAGQAIVPRAFREPLITFRSNTVGTLAVLNLARRVPTIKSIVCITSDKVYANDGKDKAFREYDPLGGNDIYSVSKATCEYIVNLFEGTHRENFLVNMQTIRLGNVVGGGDWSVDRLIPDLVRSVKERTPFKVRYLHATRPFQHVSDVVNGIRLITTNSIHGLIKSGQSWNLGPKSNSVAKVSEVIELFKHYYPELSIIKEPHQVKEDLNLRVDINKYVSSFKEPRDDSVTAIKRALSWYRSFECGAEPSKLVEVDLAGIL